MAITHHPDISMLMSCSAGSQPEVFAAIMASHLAMCPSCQRDVRRMEEIGATLFEALPPAPVDAAAPVVTARANEADDGDVRRPATRVGDIPYPLAEALGISDLDRVPWKMLAPGIWHHQLPLTKGAKGDLRLVKVAPGKQIPEHGHGGEELTLLLRGSYRDEFGHFQRGDVADLDDSVEHKPIADPKDGCICLIATERQARFKGLIARILQPFTGM